MPHVPDGHTATPTPDEILAMTSCSICGNHAFEQVRDRLYRCTDCGKLYRMDGEGWLRGASPGEDEIAERAGAIRNEHLATKGW